jgi:polyisoprenoid-binding protein YceI
MRAHRRAALALLIAAASPTAAASDLLWHSQAEGSELNFSAWYEGEEIPGRFSRFAVQLTTDDSTGEPAALTVEVEVGSADMSDAEINQELAEPDWFDSASFPAARYLSDDIAASAGGYVAAGRLLLKGVERPLQVPLAWRREGERATLSGSVDLSRLAWQVGGGEWASDASLKDRVRVSFEIRMVPAD